MASNQKNSSSFSINNIVNQENAEERDPAGLPFVWDEGNVLARVDSEVEVPTRNENSSCETIEEEVEEVFEAEEVETAGKNKTSLQHFSVKERLNEIMQEVQIECECKLKMLRRVIYYLSKSGIAISHAVRIGSLTNLQALYTVLKPMLLIKYEKGTPARIAADEVYLGLLKRLLTENQQEIQEISDIAAFDHLSSLISTSKRANNSSSSQSTAQSKVSRAKNDIYRRLKRRIDEILSASPIDCFSALNMIRRVMYRLSTALGKTIPAFLSDRYQYNLVDTFNAVKLMLCDHYKVEMSRKMTLEQHVQLLERFLSENLGELEKVSDRVAIIYIENSGYVEPEFTTINNANDHPVVHSESSSPSLGSKRKSNGSLANEPQSKKPRTIVVTTNLNLCESTNDNVDNFTFLDFTAQNDNSGSSMISTPWISENGIAPYPIVRVDEETTLNTAAKVLYNQIEKLIKLMGLPSTMKMTDFLRRIVYCLIEKHNIKFTGTSSKNFYKNSDSLLAVLRCMLPSFNGKNVKVKENEVLFRYLSEYALDNIEFIKNINDNGAVEFLRHLI